MGITLDVTHVSSLHTMLSHQPELVCDTSIADRRLPWLARLPSFCFEQGISGQGQPNHERELDRRVQNVFLKCVDNAVFHFESFRAPNIDLAILKGWVESLKIPIVGGISSLPKVGFGRRTLPSRATSGTRTNPRR